MRRELHGQQDTSEVRRQDKDEDGLPVFCASLPCCTFEDFDNLETELSNSKDKRRDMVSANL